jgi:hypothetical protein
MAKKFFMIISISNQSYDYDLLLNYIQTTPGVSKLCIIQQGFFIEITFEEDDDRRRWLGSIIKLDVDEITFHEVLYEEFLPQRKQHT